MMIYQDGEVRDKRVFAMLTAHPAPPAGPEERNVFPIINVHGYVQVEDFDGNDIERKLACIPWHGDAAVSEGHLLSIRQVFQELQQLHLGHPA